MVWPFKKQEINIVTIPDAAWAKNTSEDIAKSLEVKETKVLLNRIGRWIALYVKNGKTDLSIDAFYLEDNYKTPRWVLRDNIVNALTQYGYEVDKGMNLNFYINIKWGDVPVCPDFNFAKPTTRPNPGPRNKAGE